MFKLSLAPIALAVGLFAVQPATAVPFDPNLGLPAHFNIDETTDALTINIVGYGFDASVLGTYWMNEEPPFYTFASDSLTVANDGNGFGVITLVSADLPRASTTCDAAPDESQPGQFLGQTVPAGHCVLDLPLANSGGMDLGIDLFSPAGDVADPNFSDSIDITVPEPATLAVLGLSLAAIGMVRRRR